MRSVQILVGDPFLAATLDLPFRRIVGSDRVLRCWDGLAILEFVSSTGRYRYEPPTDDLRLIVMHEALPIMGPEEVTRRIRSNPSMAGRVTVVIVGEHEVASDVDAERVELIDDDVVRSLLARAGLDASASGEPPAPLTPEELDEMNRWRRQQG